jgi:hypothetical protein
MTVPGRGLLPLRRSYRPAQGNGVADRRADTFAARLRFGRFIGMVSAEENTYFLRAFEALGVTETRRRGNVGTDLFCR